MSDLAAYLYEIGQLKRVPRSGWTLVGVARPECVAEHTFRTAVIAFVLAERSGADPHRAASLALFHDTAEARVGDAHRIAKRYVDWSKIQERAVGDQTASLPDELGRTIRSLWAEADAVESAEARIVRDADHLECLLQAKEYAARGFETAEWIESAVNALLTDEARVLAKEIVDTPPDAWQSA